MKRERRRDGFRDVLTWKKAETKTGKPTGENQGFSGAANDSQTPTTEREGKGGKEPVLRFFMEGSQAQDMQIPCREGG